MEFWADFAAYCEHLAGAVLLSPTSFLSIWVLGFALVTSAVWYCVSKRRLLRPALLMRALFPDHFLTGRSARADWLMTALALTVFSASWLVALLNAEAMTAHVQAALTALTGASAPLTMSAPAARTITTLVAFLAFELAYFLDHWLNHHVPFFWEYHKVHHTAQTLSPLTMFRVHPVDGFMYLAFVIVFESTSVGMCVWAFGPEASPLRIDGVNVILLVAIYLVVTLQHSQVWIPLRGLAGRLILSPAHHQLHHSADPAHYNCNLGYVVAFWDWAFGTLRLPEAKSPRLRFGVTGLAHDPHSAKGLLVTPVFDSVRTILPIPRTNDASLNMDSAPRTSA